jgi:hypothetical protein
MKTLKGLTITLAISAFILTSCDKDTAAEKKLNGTWTIDSYKIDTLELINDTTAMTMSFADCNKEANTCEAIVTTNNTDADTLDYSIEGNGMYFVTTSIEEDTSGSEITVLDTIDITELNASSLKLSSSIEMPSFNEATFEIVYSSVPLIIELSKQ